MAKDAVEAAPNVYTVLFENERVRLLEGRVRPGESSTMHTHPAGLTYILQGGKAAIDTSTGDHIEVELSPGRVNWKDAEEHSGTNLGDADIVVLFFEPKSFQPDTTNPTMLLHRTP